MKINELIRKYRKEQHLTQEQVANYLGVTAPAVNKWENGISYPDITLLAPLARFLRTDVDTLLSFHDELSDMEIDKIIIELSEEIATEGFMKSFEKVSRLIKEYPSCDKLILNSAQLLNVYVLMEEIEDKETYKKQITAWYEVVAFGDDKELSNMATVSLCQDYITNGKYEEAQKLLDKMPSIGFDKRILQANIYGTQENYDKVYEIHEELLYQNASAIVTSLLQIIQLKCKQKEYDDALHYAKLARLVSKNFELGQYIANSSDFMIAVEKKDIKETLRLAEELISGVKEIYCIKESKLYSHKKFNEDPGHSMFKDMIKKTFENDKDLDFIRNEPGFLRIKKKLTELDTFD
ncbi:helix-turn-helix domain-containing protein [Anaerosporobacter sp.]